MSETDRLMADDQARPWRCPKCERTLERGDHCTSCGTDRPPGEAYGESIGGTTHLPIASDGPGAALSCVSGPKELLALAIEKEGGIDVIERLAVLLERQQDRDAAQAFNAAMRDVQAEVRPVIADGHNAHTDTKYPKYDAIHKMLVPIYTKHGFSVSHDEIESPREGETRFRAVVRHIGGHCEHFHLDLPLDDVGPGGKKNKTLVHAKVSSASYAKRTLEMRIFGVACAGQDDDGNAAGGAVEMVSAMAADEMVTLLRDMDEEGVSAFWTWAGVGTLAELTAKQAAEALPRLRKYAKRAREKAGKKEEGGL